MSDYMVHALAVALESPENDPLRHLLLDEIDAQEQLNMTA